MSTPARTRTGSRAALGAIAITLSSACGGGATDARYPPRPNGCAVKAYPTEAAIPVDDLGVVRVSCTGPNLAACERALEDAVCRVGGDVVWGVGANALDDPERVGHAAHSKRATQGSRERGCAVQVFEHAPPMRTENIGQVTALCSEDDTPGACERELKDQACLLGGDVLWQIEGPTLTDTPNGRRQEMHGRAAHTQAR